MAKERSPYLVQKEPKERIRGMRAYDPEQVYRYLFDNSDRYGIIIYTQKDLAEAIKIQRETLNYFYQDFLAIGLLEKVSRAKFKVMVHPDEFEWTDEVYDTLSRLRKRHQYAYKEKNIEGE